MRACIVAEVAVQLKASNFLTVNTYIDGLTMAESTTTTSRNLFSRSAFSADQEYGFACIDYEARL